MKNKEIDYDNLDVNFFLKKGKFKLNKKIIKMNCIEHVISLLENGIMTVQCIISFGMYSNDRIKDVNLFKIFKIFNIYNDLKSSHTSEYVNVIGNMYGTFKGVFKDGVKVSNYPIKGLNIQRGL